MLKTFTGKSQAEIARTIQKYLDLKRDKERALMEEVKEENDPTVLGKDEDRKRKFLVVDVGRPHKRVWNFIQEEDAENHIPHVLRADARPQLAYEDGRIEELLELISFMAIHLSKFQEQTWKQLNMYTLEIFKTEDEELNDLYKIALEKAKEAQ